MKKRFQAGRRLCRLAWIALVPCASTQVTFDLSADYSASQNPNGAWSFGWMPPDSSFFHPYTMPSAAAGLSLNEWRSFSPEDNGTAPPDVIKNPTDTPITVSDTMWLPHQVTFHPGQNGERSVIRWTSPVTGTARLFSAFEGRSGFVTSGLEIYQNSVLLFSGAVIGTGGTSQISFATNIAIKIGETIDFRVDYGNGDWASDTTQIGVVIKAVPKPSLTMLSPSSFSVRLTWPTNSQGYLLESSAQLPATLWVPVTNQPLVLGDRFVLTLGKTNPSQFFRLREQ